MHRLHRGVPRTGRRGHCSLSPSPDSWQPNLGCPGTRSASPQPPGGSRLTVSGRDSHGLTPRPPHVPSPPPRHGPREGWVHFLPKRQLGLAAPQGPGRQRPPWEQCPLGCVGGTVCPGGLPQVCSHLAHSGGNQRRLLAGALRPGPGLPPGRVGAAAACGPGLPGTGTDPPPDAHPYRAAIPKTRDRTRPEAPPGLGAVWSCWACCMSPPSPPARLPRGRQRRPAAQGLPLPSGPRLAGPACSTFPGHAVPIRAPRASECHRGWNKVTCPSAGSWQRRLGEEWGEGPGRRGVCAHLLETEREAERVRTGNQRDHPEASGRLGGEGPARPRQWGGRMGSRTGGGAAAPGPCRPGAGGRRQPPRPGGQEGRCFPPRPAPRTREPTGHEATRRPNWTCSPAGPALPTPSGMSPVTTHP